MLPDDLMPLLLDDWWMLIELKTWGIRSLRECSKSMHWEWTSLDKREWISKGSILKKMEGNGASYGVLFDTCCFPLPPSFFQITSEDTMLLFYDNVQLLSS